MPALHVLPSMSPRVFTALAAAIVFATCSRHDAPHDASASVSAEPAMSGTPMVVTDTIVTTTFDAAGVADPVQEATMSTKLMGAVTAVHVTAGQMVRVGQPLVEIDARDLTAKAAQVAASVADAEAMQREAATQAARFTALYQDSAATRAQYDAALTGLARADAGLRAARASVGELESVRSYATVRAPFSGMITMRTADVGSFAAPGAPLVTIQDISSLRLSASIPAEVARTLHRGSALLVQVDGDSGRATVEGVMPTRSGGLFIVNARLINTSNRYRAGSVVTLHVPMGTRAAIVVPHNALVREGDLVGVIVRQNGLDARRWVRIGMQTVTHVEIVSGLRVGETIVRPAAAPSPAQGGI